MQGILRNANRNIAFKIQKKYREFCRGSGWIYRFIQSWRNGRVKLPDVQGDFRFDPIINGKLILIAPVSQGLVYDHVNSLRSVHIFAIDGDEIAKPQFHARSVYDALQKNINSTYIEHPGHHFAFIAPLPKWLLDRENIPVANDPPGFDRSAFLAHVNGGIVGALSADP